MDTVYDLVKECCNENSISIKALEEATGLSNGTIGHWRKGGPALRTLLKVSNYFDKPVDFFIPKN